MCAKMCRFSICRLLRAMVIKGMLESTTTSTVNLVNADLLAKERGLRIIESTVPDNGKVSRSPPPHKGQPWNSVPNSIRASLSTLTEIVLKGLGFTLRMGHCDPVSKRALASVPIQYEYCKQSGEPLNLSLPWICLKCFYSVSWFSLACLYVTEWNLIKRLMFRVLCRTS